MKKVKDFEEGIRVLVVGEYLAGGTTYRQLARKYGVPRTTIYRWVEAGVGENKAVPDKSLGMGPDESVEMKRLKAELEKTRLKNKLLSAMIEIAEEQLGVDIRKKRGARR
jgi:transposase-like protein